MKTQQLRRIPPPPDALRISVLIRFELTEQKFSAFVSKILGIPVHSIVNRKIEGAEPEAACFHLKQYDSIFSTK